MNTNKANTVCMLKILEEYSDEDHILTAKEISEKFKTLYDMTLDRRTVYSTINTLSDIGYEISNYEENGTGYFLKVRDFDSADIRLLIDAVNSFEYISPKQTRELNEKLKKKLSVHERKKYKMTNLVRMDKKSPNSQVFLNIDILDQAINEGKKIKFTYMDYNYDKKLEARRQEPYIADPYAMIVESEHYYLVMILNGKTDPSFYRIDMMKDIEILSEDITISRKDADLDSISKVVYAHAGRPERIRLKCRKKALRYCLERFGFDIMIIPLNNGDMFEASFTAPPEGILYWALQQLQDVEVLEPQSLREKIIDIIKNQPYNS